MLKSRRYFLPLSVLAAIALVQTTHGAETELLWGDTHLHTSNSFDAFLRENTSADPDTAYRFAKGDCFFLASQ